MKYKTIVVTELSKLHLVAVGGLDPSGGAGILRDGLTARSVGSSFRLVGTAWAEQSPVRGVQAIDPRPQAELHRAIRLALEDAPSATAVKVGMAVNPHTLLTIVNALDGFEGPVVFDPVMGATAGGALFDTRGLTLREAMAPLVARSTVVTPNAREAALLCDREVNQVEEAEWCGHALARQGARAVVVKGGHLACEDVVDVVVTKGESHRLQNTRVPGRSVRGTGCSYASTLALHLAAGHSLLAACAAAQAHVAEGIRRASALGSELQLGHG